MMWSYSYQVSCGKVDKRAAILFAIAILFWVGIGTVFTMFTIKSIVGDYEYVTTAGDITSTESYSAMILVHPWEADEAFRSGHPVTCTITSPSNHESTVEFTPDKSFQINQVPYAPSSAFELEKGTSHVTCTNDIQPLRYGPSLGDFGWTIVKIIALIAGIIGAAFVTMILIGLDLRRRNRKREQEANAGQSPFSETPSTFRSDEPRPDTEGYTPFDLNE